MGNIFCFTLRSEIALLAFRPTSTFPGMLMWLESRCMSYFWSSGETVETNLNSLDKGIGTEEITNMYLVGKRVNLRKLYELFFR